MENRKLMEKLKNIYSDVEGTGSKTLMPSRSLPVRCGGGPPARAPAHGLPLTTPTHIHYAEPQPGRAPPRDGAHRNGERGADPAHQGEREARHAGTAAAARPQPARTQQG